MYDVCIIGGGASGIAAGIFLGRKGIKTVVLERNDRILKKVLATGNGRCNFTNMELSHHNYYGDNRDFVKVPLNIFSQYDTMDFFETIGIYSAVEKGRVYPLNFQASSVVDMLRFECERVGLEIITGFDVEEIKKSRDTFIVKSGDNTIKSKICIIAAGGKSSPGLGSNGSGYSLLSKFGHSITKLTPALVRLKTEKNTIKGMNGIKIYAGIDVLDKNGNELGVYKEDEFLFTKDGISGTACFELSYLLHFYNELIFKVDLLTTKIHDELEKILLEKQTNMPNITCENFLNGILNKRLGILVCKIAGIEKMNMKSKDITHKQIKDIAELIKDYRIKVIGTDSYKDSQATAGGISTSEVNNKTFESKKVDNLYITGEVLDVLGDCGGYNLQWAWTSGYCAAKDIISKMK